MPSARGSLTSLPPEPVDADEQRPLLDEQHPDHGTITAEQAIREGRAVVEAAQGHVAGETSGGRLVLIMGPLYLAAFCAALDSTIVATLASPISTSFRSFTLLSWLASGYLIANAAVQPLSGRMSDIYGRRAGIIFACTFFAVGTLMCGLAPSASVMIAGRLVAGVGGGCTNAMSAFVATDLIPLRKRGLWQGYGNLVYGVGMAIGGIYGGFMNDTVGWRWAFHIQVPLIVLAGVLSAIFVDMPVKESDTSKLKRVDFLGSLTLSVSLILLLLGLNSGGNTVPWNHPLVYVSIPVSILCLILFVLIELRVPEPIIPVRLLTRRTVAAACITNWFYTMSVFAVFYYGPIYFEVIQNLSATATGSRLIPSSIGIAIGSLSTGFIMRATGRYHPLNCAVALLSVTSTAAIAIFFRPGLGMWQPLLILGIHGVAYGGMLTVTLLALLAAVGHKDHAVITSASYAFRSTGSTIGITVAGAVFQNILSARLWERFGDYPDAAEVIARLRDDLDAVKGLGPRWRKGVEEAYADALRGVWGVVLVLAAAAAIASLCMKEHSLARKLDRR